MYQSLSSKSLLTKLVTKSSLVLLASTAMLSVNAAAGSVMGTFNLIVTENLNGVAEVEGRTFVGQNLAIQNAAQFGFALSAQQVAANRDTLVVNGAITGQNAGTVKVSKGDLRYNGSINPTNLVEFQGGGSKLANTYSVADIKTELSSFSNFLKSKPGTTPTFVPNSNQFNLTAGTPDSGGFSVLSLTADSIFGNGKNGTVFFNNLANTNALVINVSGTTINWQNGANMSFLSLADRSKVIWNFFEATAIHVSGKAFFGSLLAPLANLTSNGGDFNGSVAVKNLNISAEVHLGTYSGPGLPPAVNIVPLPPAAFAGLALLATVAIPTIRRRMISA
jgi:choice-of-anchor A domain-containing protein